MCAILLIRLHETRLTCPREHSRFTKSVQYRWRSRDWVLWSKINPEARKVRNSDVTNDVGTATVESGSSFQVGRTETHSRALMRAHRRVDCSFSHRHSRTIRFGRNEHFDDARENRISRYARTRPLFFMHCKWEISITDTHNCDDWRPRWIFARLSYCSILCVFLDIKHKMRQHTHVPYTERRKRSSNQVLFWVWIGKYFSWLNRLIESLCCVRWEILFVPQKKKIGFNWISLLQKSVQSTRKFYLHSNKDFVGSVISFSQYTRSISKRASNKDAIRQSVPCIFISINIAMSVTFRGIPLITSCNGVNFGLRLCRAFTSKRRRGHLRLCVQWPLSGTVVATALDTRNAFSKAVHQVDRYKNKLTTN